MVYLLCAQIRFSTLLFLLYHLFCYIEHTCNHLQVRPLLFLVHPQMPQNALSVLLVFYQVPRPFYVWS